jgi:hypothetical protein
MLGSRRFEVFQVESRIVPAVLRRARHQTLGGINLLIAPLGEHGFVLGTFESNLPLAQQGLIARLQLLESHQRKLQFAVLQGLQDFFCDGAIEPIATEAHAITTR